MPALLEVLKKTRKGLTQDNRPPSRDLNLGLPNQKVEVLTTLTRFSVLQISLT